MLELKNVRFDYYGENETTLSLNIPEGLTLVLGEIGSYKTTLLRIIGGVKIISDGEILLDGENIEELPPKKRDMALVGADSLPTCAKIKKALSLPLRLRGMSAREAEKPVREAAARFGLNINSVVDKTNLAPFFAARLSLRRTRVTMFDEPYHFFGEGAENDVTEMIRSRGGYVIVTSCDGEDLFRLNPDHVIVLRRGEILFCGAPDELDFGDKYMELFIGFSKAPHSKGQHALRPKN